MHVDALAGHARPEAIAGPLGHQGIQPQGKQGMVVAVIIVQRHPAGEIQALDLPSPQIKAPNIAFSVPDLPLAFSGPYIGAVRQGPPDRDFIAISRVAPQYPYRAQRRGIEGWVRVSLLITEQGTVRDVVVVSAEPEGIFDQAAIKAVSKWKFKPRIQDGKPVSIRVEQVVNFTLGKG
jgi:protein TonB